MRWEGHSRSFILKFCFLNVTMFYLVHANEFYLDFMILSFVRCYFTFIALLLILLSVAKFLFLKELK